MDDYYHLLDVAPDAPREEIRTAYREKREELQGEEGDGNRAKVARLNRAWNVLSDPAQRDRYDDRLAEHRESGEPLDDDVDDGNDGEPRTKAQQRAAARQARATRQPTIAIPEGLTMASTKSRLGALGFDLLVLIGIFLAIYQLGLSYVDNKFPGQRHRASELVTLQNDSLKKIDADKKLASDADKAAKAAVAKHDSAAELKAKDAATAARAAQAKEQKHKDALSAEAKKINTKIGPTINIVFVIAMLLLLVYLVPSTALTGQTLGKRLRRIRVVKLDGSIPGWPTALKRFGVPVLVGTLLAVLLRFGPLGLAVAVLGIIGWISNPNKQGLHDRLAKTIVVDA